MKQNQLSENETIRYKVVYDGKILLDSVPKSVAENFIGTLDKTIQESVNIIPVTEDGLQVLLG